MSREQELDVLLNTRLEKDKTDRGWRKSAYIVCTWEPLWDYGEWDSNGEFKVLGKGQFNRLSGHTTEEIAVGAAAKLIEEQRVRYASPPVILKRIGGKYYDINKNLFRGTYKSL